MLERLLRQPVQKRKRFVLFVSTAITLVIFSVWYISFRESLLKVNQTVDDTKLEKDEHVNLLEEQWNAFLDYF